MTHLAELNLARPSVPLDDPRIADFVDNLDRINGIAERSKGFVWRLKDENGNATSLIMKSDPELIVNVSVWETAEDLEHFVWNTLHKQFYRRKSEWFTPMTTPHFVMWPVEEGHRPDVREAEERVRHLAEHGSTDFAFGWEHLPNIRQWMEMRCA